MSATPAQSTLQTLAFEIADDATRADVECCGTLIVINDQPWYELSKLTADEHRIVGTALRYMHSRGDALPYRVICHPEYPYLRRFESKP